MSSHSCELVLAERSVANIGAFVIGMNYCRAVCYAAVDWICWLWC